MFVIDSITFVYGHAAGLSWYYVENESFPHIFNTLKEYCIKNGVAEDGFSYIVETPQVEIYLFDYKIPINCIEYYNPGYELYIYSDTNVLPDGYVWLLIGDSTLYCNLSPMDGGWTFDHIPTTSVEAILFVEFAKQYGVDAIKTSGLNGISASWNEENKSLYMMKGQLEYIIYGAGNGELTGHIEELFGGV